MSFVWFGINSPPKRRVIFHFSCSFHFRCGFSDSSVDHEVIFSCNIEEFVICRCLMGWAWKCISLLLTLRRHETILIFPNAFYFCLSFSRLLVNSQLCQFAPNLTTMECEQSRLTSFLTPRDRQTIFVMTFLNLTDYARQNSAGYDWIRFKQLPYVRSHGSLFYSRDEVWPISDRKNETFINKAEIGKIKKWARNSYVR